MKRTFLMSMFAVLVLWVFTGCHSMKKLQHEVIETAVVGQVTPSQLEAGRSRGAGWRIPAEQGILKQLFI